ncbi:MAG TPA: S-layer homology domain-containing protein [Armatimonadota bacterium]|nr:S-layer homology domain-containing protein [Armatimonadota bacterium]
MPNTGCGESGTEPYWAYKYVEYAVDAGVIAGYDDDLCHPEWEVTRGQMAAFMARAMCGGDQYVPSPSGAPRFPDVTETENAWCYPYVEYIAAEEVTLGYPDGLYYPQIACSRDQMAAYLCRAFGLPTPPRPYYITARFPLGGSDSWGYEGPDGVYSKSISGTEELHGVVYAGLASDEDGSIEYWLPQPEGLYLGGRYEAAEGTISFSPALLIPNGLDPGDSGNQMSTAYLGEETGLGAVAFNWEFVGVETVTVPAGTFEDCMKLHLMVYTSGNPDEFYVWAAEGVGVVKMDSGAFGGDDWEVLIAADVDGTQYPSNSGPFELARYRPLDVGSTWVYSGSDGESIDQVTGVDDVDGIEAARISEGPAIEEPDRMYFTIIDDAVAFVGEYDSDSGSVTSFSPPIALPVSASVGDSGTESTQVYLDGIAQGTATFEWAVVGAGPLTVPAGTFENCVKLRIATGGPGEEPEPVYMWLALGVGVVKEDSRPFGDTWWRQLTSASVGGVEHPTAGRTFDITDYLDLTVGNEWDYEIGIGRLIGGTPYPYGGYDWAAVQDLVVDGYTRYLRTDATGLHYLGKDGGIAGWSYRFDPPLTIANELAVGDGGSQTSAYSENGSYEGDADFEYTFDGIEAVSTQAGFFTDCMKITYSLHLPGMPTGAAQTKTEWFARGIGVVSEMFDTVADTLTSAQIGEQVYPVTDGVYDVTDYFPVNMSDQWAVEHLGEGWYGASMLVVDGTQFLGGLGISETVYKMSWYGSEGFEGSDLVAVRADGVARYGFVDPSDGPMVANPPLFIPNGYGVGDSGTGTSTLYVWAVDHWENAGSMDGSWEIVAAGPITTPAGRFPDCLLIRWAVQPPGLDPIVSYGWLARGIGMVRQYEVGEGEWEELMGATILGATTPDTIPAVAPVTDFVSQGAGVGFDFSAGTNVAQPEEQDLKFLYYGSANALMQSFDAGGISRYIGHGEYDFGTIREYSTFLPPEWDVWGDVWWTEATLLSVGFDASEETAVVKTREGRYALIRIVDVTATQLEIQYIYPYGWFDWE